MPESVSRRTCVQNPLNGSPRVLQDLAEGRIPFLLALPRYWVFPEERRVSVGLRVLQVAPGRARRPPHREDLSAGSAKSGDETITRASNCLRLLRRPYRCAPASAFGVPTTCAAPCTRCGRCIPHPNVVHPTQSLCFCALPSQGAYRGLQSTASDRHPPGPNRLHAPAQYSVW